MLMGELLRRYSKSCKFKDLWIVGFIYILVNMRMYYRGINLVVHRIKDIGLDAKIHYAVEVGHIIFDKPYINICLLIFLAYTLMKCTEDRIESVAFKLFVGSCLVLVSFVLNIAVTRAVFIRNISEPQSYEILYNVTKSITLDFIINVALLYIFMFIHSFYKNGFIAGVVSWGVTVNIESSYDILSKCKIIKESSNLNKYLTFLDISKYNGEFLLRIPAQFENLRIKLIILGCLIVLSIVINYFAHAFNKSRGKNNKKNKMIEWSLVVFQIIAFLFVAVDIIQPAVKPLIPYFAQWDLIFLISAVVFYICIPKILSRFKKVVEIYD